MVFSDRFEAGRRLAEKLNKYRNSVVLAIPRGGVLTAEPVANALNSKLALVIIRKLGMPQNEEQGFGAIDQDGEKILNDSIISASGMPEYVIESVSKKELEKIRERERIYETKMPDIKNMVVIIVDDGLATGYTMLASVNYVKKRKPKKIVVAVPTAHYEAYEKIKAEVDDIICLEVVESPDYAVGAFYEDFHDVPHEEVKEILKRAGRQYK